MHSFILSSIAGGAVYGLRLFPVVVLLSVAELLFPARRVPWRGTAKAFVFWLLSLPVAGACGALLGVLQTALHVRPIISFAAWPVHGPLEQAIRLVVTCVAWLVVNDFFYYWLHRAEHRWLWSLHRVHHSIRDMRAAHSWHHVGEFALQAATFAIPGFFLVDMGGDIGPIVIPMLGVIIGQFSHSNIAFSLGPLRALFCDNRFHRIHHSIEPKHFDRNFGGTTTVWDRVFGTILMPAATDWHDTGVADFAEPEKLTEWLAAPFREARRLP